MDLTNVKPLDIDAYLGKIKNKIALAGVELEGAWTEYPVGVQVERDSSVFNDRMPTGAKVLGEVPIGPVLPAGLPELIRTYHPDKVNHTCGLHVHMSFDKLWYYHMLMVPEYQETIIEYLTRWAKTHKVKEDHCLWPRLRGESRYCQKKFWPDMQATTKRKEHDQNKPGHRYTMIHYCGRMQPYPTIECRVLPMFKSKTISISAVMEVINITNACLYVLGKQAGKDKPTTGKVSLPNNLVYEETITEQL